MIGLEKVNSLEYKEFPEYTGKPLEDVVNDLIQNNTQKCIEITSLCKLYGNVFSAKLIRTYVDGLKDYRAEEVKSLKDAKIRTIIEGQELITVSIIVRDPHFNWYV